MVLLPKYGNLLLLGFVLLCVSLDAPAPAQQPVGNIIGHVRVARGDAPPQSILVSLELRGATMNSVYTDGQGTFGFHTLDANLYYVDINDDHYEPVHKEAFINASMLSQTLFLEINLVPKASAKPAPASGPSPAGTNPSLTDVREYFSHFPKPAVKEFEKGVQADSQNKKNEAIRHYAKAVQIAPDFYYAHNNLGSDYLSQSEFPAARKEFETVVKLNQSDAAAYFNLSNVCMLMGQISDAQHFLDEGMRRQPDSALGQFLLGSLNIHLGKKPEAEKALLQAIQLDPVMVQPRLQLVNLLLQQGRKADAAAQLHDFVSAFPDNPFSSHARQLLQHLESSADSPAVPN